MLETKTKVSAKKTFSLQERFFFEQKKKASVCNSLQYTRTSRKELNIIFWRLLYYNFYPLLSLSGALCHHFLFSFTLIFDFLSEIKFGIILCVRTMFDNFKKHFLFYFAKCILIILCFVMFILLMSDVWTKFTTAFTSTAIGFSSRDKYLLPRIVIRPKVRADAKSTLS